MGSVILGYVGSMATVLVVLMLLLNDYLQPSAQVAVQPQPLPAIGRVAAAPEPQATLPATPGATRSISAVAPADTAGVQTSPAQPQASSAIAAKEAAKEPPPVSTDILGNKANEVAQPVAVEEPTTDKSKPTKSAHNRKHHRQYYPSAMGFAGGPSFRGGSFGPWR